MNTIKRLYLVLAAVALTLPQLASAQANPDSVHHRNQCRLAAQVIQSGHPAPKWEWAWTYIDACLPSERAETYLSAIRQVRTSSDLRLIHRSVMPVVWFRDGRLFEAVLELAGDPGAATPARVVAFVALARIKEPQATASYEGFIGGSTEINGIPVARCSGSRGHTTGYLVGSTAMPTDYRERIISLAREVATDPRQPRNVRSAAACTG